MKIPLTSTALLKVQEVSALSSGQEIECEIKRQKAKKKESSSFYFHGQLTPHTRYPWAREGQRASGG